MRRARDIDADLLRYKLEDYIGRFGAEGVKVSRRRGVKAKPRDKFERGCVLLCSRSISDRNKSGVCTDCWNQQPHKAAAVWDQVREERGL